MAMTEQTKLSGGNLEGRHLGLALTVISCAQLMIVLDATVVNVAIPTIHSALHFSGANLEWLITAYSLTFGGLLLFGGRTGDLFGKRRMFMLGIIIFALASLLGGLATNDVWLIITRGVQGIGAAIAAPTALALIATNFPEGRERNRAMGVYAAMSGGGGAVGLLLGGLLTSYVSWRWIFFVNVPIAAVVLFLAPRALNESDTTSGRLDVPGAVTATGGMLALVYGFSNVSSHSWSSLSTIIALAAAVVLLVAFGLIERRSAEPLMPLSIFSNRNRTASFAMMLCIGIALFALFYFLTLYLQNILGYSAIRTGVGFLPMTIGIIIAAGLTSRLVTKIGIRLPLIVGPALAVAGMLWITRITVTSTYLDILGPLVLIALGLGFVFVPLTLTAVSGVQDQEAGLASALLNTMQQIGGAIGLAVLATVAIDSTNSQLHGMHNVTSKAHEIATTHGYTTAFFVSAGITFIALIISIVAIRVPKLAPGETLDTSSAVIG
ncbi:MAG TPA: MFS transporter [Acidimicrobiales bacterium]|jgi:EmrB/QacA subfamily drug resistance transporter|nr:MFS transporter [Acidimicrobiales bacterium]